jgi:hypothetical protein
MNMDSSRRELLRAMSAGRWADGEWLPPTAISPFDGNTLVLRCVSVSGHRVGAPYIHPDRLGDHSLAALKRWQDRKDVLKLKELCEMPVATLCNSSIRN